MALIALGFGLAKGRCAMGSGSRKPVLSKLVLTLIGSFLILTVSAASDALAQDTWSTTGSMSVGRAFAASATLLKDGRVLVAGGEDDSIGGTSAELYNPTTGTWSATGSMSVARFSHTATLLTDGRVLVVGGDSNGTSAELYSPTTGTWSPTGSTSVGRFGGTATLLTDGRVLVAGGGACSINSCTESGTRAELYNPTTGTWSPTGSTSVGRFGGTATRLPDGRVLVAGGGACSINSCTEFGTRAELYDPTTGTWSPTGSTSVGRVGGTATLLPDGQVLVAGGGLNGTSAELYDPTTGTWSPTGSMSVSNGGFFSTATLLLLDGR